MKVLVTGAAGFIGRHVCKALQEEGHQVIGLDMVTDGLDCTEWIEADITKPLATPFKLDAVIHLAALANPRECDNNPSRAFDVNVNGTHQVLKMALESGAKKVVFSSSAHVYDIPPKYLPTDEVHPLRLNNVYTTSKILGEQLCQLFFENHGVSYTTLRLYNAYGDGQMPGYFIPDMIAKGGKGRFELKGGNTKKDFVYIDDVVHAFVLALGTSFVGPVNIGTGQATNLWEVAEVIAKETGAEFHFSLDPTATEMRSDSARAYRVLHWAPTKTIWEGLRATLDAAKVAVP